MRFYGAFRRAQTLVELYYILHIGRTYTNQFFQKSISHDLFMK